MRVLLLLPLSALLLSAAEADEWPRYRGPNGTGLGDASAQLSAEIGKDKNVLWKVSISKGNSSPIAVKGRLFFTGWEADERLVFCHDAAKGTLLWRAAIKKDRAETAHPLNGAATPTLATDGRRVFTLFPEFGLVAYNLDGKEERRLPLGPFAPIQGIATSPLYA